MNINKLRHRVNIEANVGNGNDGGGNLVPLWQTIATTWAEVKPINGFERTIAEQRREEITHKVRMRHRNDIVKDRHRINYKGRIFKIEYIVNVNEANVELELHCKEG